jgi:hypothetical protein
MQHQHAEPGIQRPVARAVQPHSQSENYAPLLVLGVAVVLAAVLVGWLLLRGNARAAPTFHSTGPALVTPAQLERASAAFGSPIYWAGPRDGYSYELTVTSGGRVYVRYLPKGVAAGDPRANFLTVGTYRGDDAYADLKLASGGKKVHSRRLPGGGLMVAPKKLPKSVYVAFSGEPYQVELYNPAAGHSQTLATNGSLTKVR